MKSFLAGLRLVERALAVALLAGVVALVVLASGTRYLGYPVIWSIEVTQALFVWLRVLSADLTLQRHGHFSVDVLANLLPARARSFLDVANLVLIASLLGVLVYYGVVFARFTGMRPLPITGVSSAVATAALPVGFVLMLITLAEQFAARIAGRRPGAAEAPREVM